MASIPEPVAVAPIPITPLQWAESAAVILIAVSITFWPFIYALFRKRWRRAFVYFLLCLTAFSVPIYVFTWWEARNPGGDWEFESPKVLYYGLSWPVMVCLLWTVTAISDAALAPDKQQSQAS